MLDDYILGPFIASVGALFYFILRLTIFLKNTLLPVDNGFGIVSALGVIIPALIISLAKVPIFGLEVDESAFKTFAFDTHVLACLDAGLANLPYSDLLKTGGQPNVEEWLDGDTWSQAADSGVEVFKDKAEAIGNAVENAIDSLISFLNRG